MGIVGVVGHEAKKFTYETELKARAVIKAILSRPGVTDVASGHCHLGGIDIWAEEIGRDLGFPMEHISPPKTLSWTSGFMPRNMKIARDSTDEVHCIVIKEYPPDYDGMRFDYCYHCKTEDHIKSGGCWTARFAMKIGKRGIWHVV